LFPLFVGLVMADVRILAVSLEGGSRLQHITYLWTAEGALPCQRAVENLWSGRCRYYVVAPNGRIDVTPVPPRGPTLVAKVLGRRRRGGLESPRGAAVPDGLLTLPRLPSPARPRRSRAALEATR
jgi:hypothetical protein